MLHLRHLNTNPPGGFRFQDRATGWRHHSCSFKATWGAWYQENVKRGKRRPQEQCATDVEQYLCEELMKSEGWERWVIVDDGHYNPNDLSDLGAFIRDEGSPNTKGEKFVVVFPFCGADGNLAVKLMGWIAELGPYDHECLLSSDSATPSSITHSVHRSASSCFPVVKSLTYPQPGAGVWPPTIAFIAAALEMQKMGKPWLWMEADAVPLKIQWLDKLQEVYWNCGKAFAGPIIPDLGHMNGTGIYPPNTPRRIPAAMAHVRTAWDVMMKREMITDCFNLHPYYFHSWAMENGQLHPYYGGLVPSFGTQKMVDQIPNEAVIFHRCKDGSLIDRLRERRLVNVA